MLIGLLDSRLLRAGLTTPNMSVNSREFVDQYFYIALSNVQFATF